MANRINSLFTFDDRLEACAVGDNGLLLNSSDAGASWERGTVPTNSNLYAVNFPAQGAVGFACGDHGTILKSEDNGRTWSLLDSGTDTDLRAVEFPANARDGFVSGA
jgi:photosystem II stability/assembly factor-like uncharacterized protein